MATRRITELRRRRRKRGSVIFCLLYAAIIITAFMLPDRHALTEDEAEVVVNFDYTTEAWRNVEESVLSKVHYHPTNHTTNYQISKFDELFQRISTPFEINWCLMSAIAYVESRFNPKAKSNTGAVGLMQIMPRIGRHYGFDADELLNPSTNILTANLLYVDIERMLAIPRKTPARDKISLVLASYNGGISRVYDAQRLARSKGGDPHKWSDVSTELLALRYEEAYEDPVVKYGKFSTAGYTVAYVRNVMKKFDEFQRFSENCPYYLYPYAQHYDELDSSMFEQ
ncbi:MAG: transglycosylase SLT domain-containing protein [Rikenellaceae bacterium]